MNADEMKALAIDAAWKQFARMPSSNPSDIVHAVFQAIGPALEATLSAHPAEEHEDWCHAMTGCTEKDHCTCERALFSSASPTESWEYEVRDGHALVGNGFASLTEARDYASEYGSAEAWIRGRRKAGRWEPTPEGSET